VEKLNRTTLTLQFAMDRDIAGREFVCVIAPGGRDRTPPTDPQTMLMDTTLLHHVEAPTVWRKWASHHDLDTLQTLSGPRFAQYAAIIQAALSGLGAALVPKILVEDELQDGRLVAIGNPVDGDQGHYLCFASEKGERSVFAAFREWILTEGHIGERAAIRRLGRG
jgi:DNA-binding transcriptional LysR family regulator